MTKFFKFEQNYSGGEYIKIKVRDVMAHHFWVEADSEERANRISELEVGFNHDHCTCCGERFRGCSDYDPYDSFSGTIEELVQRVQTTDILWPNKELKAVLVDNGLKIVLVPKPEKSHLIGIFRAQIKTLKEPLPELKTLAYQSGKLLEINPQTYEVNVLCEVNSAEEALRRIEEREMVPHRTGYEKQNLDAAIKFDKG